MTPPPIGVHLARWKSVVSLPFSLLSSLALTGSQANMGFARDGAPLEHAKVGLEPWIMDFKNR